MLRTLISLTVCANLAWIAPAAAQETVLVIRHAEKAAGNDDPALTEAGRARAQAWAEMFAGSGIDIVITSDARRTRETGSVIASALDVERTETPMADIATLMDLLTFDYAEDTVLVVGHTETIPRILSDLGVFEMIEIDPHDFGSLFVVAPGAGDEPNLVRLRMP